MLALDWNGLGGFVASVATLITAIVGGYVVIRRLRETHDKVDQAATVAEQVAYQLNGDDVPPGEPATLGQTVRQMSEEQQRQADELAALRRELGTAPPPPPRRRRPEGRKPESDG